MKEIEPSTTTVKRMPAVRRTAVNAQTLIKTSLLQPGQALPLVVAPNLEGVELASWLKNNLAFVEASLLEHGGILFRGFDLRTQSDFDNVISALPYSLMHYIEGATPRTQLSPNVYTSTEYPQDQSIALHNELTYVVTWPMKIWFYCLNPAQERGETPIADVRKVYQRIDSSIREKFMQTGWMLVRNFGESMSLPWQKSFRTSSRSEVEDYCRNARIEWEWKTGDRLKTRQVRPAAAKHPRTGEWVWFNHVAFWHVSSLEPDVRRAMLNLFDEDDLPYNTYYGDGTRIEPSVVEQLRDAYRQETVEFTWRKGDLLMLDNMLVAHGRNPFVGARKILVAMGEPYGPGADAPDHREAR